jgi:cell division FtsZ-interacting protein ZapD
MAHGCVDAKDRYEYYELMKSREKLRETLRFLRSDPEVDTSKVAAQLQLALDAVEKKMEELIG